LIVLWKPWSTFERIENRVKSNSIFNSNWNISLVKKITQLFILCEKSFPFTKALKIKKRNRLLPTKSCLLLWVLNIEPRIKELLNENNKYYNNIISLYFFISVFINIYPYYVFKFLFLIKKCKWLVLITFDWGDPPIEKRWYKSTDVF
jgi:hypothetical protein